MEESKVKVPQKVLDGILAVRSTGKTNMLDVISVCHIARKLELKETADWIDTNRVKYLRLIFYGNFEVI